MRRLLAHRQVKRDEAKEREVLLERQLRQQGSDLRKGRRHFVLGGGTYGGEAHTLQFLSHSFAQQRAKNMCKSPISITLPF